MIGSLIGAAGSLIGGLFGSKSAEKQNRQNIKMQKEFAQNGIQWKVQDAEKAGVHPLYALGANTHSFSPVNVGDPLGGAIADMGQNIGRAVDSGRTGNERVSAQLQQLAVQRAELENTKLASEIALMRQPGTPPAPVVENVVVPGQGNAVKTVPSEVDTVAGPGITAGAPADTTLYAAGNGYRPGMSERYAEGAGESIPGMLTWAADNYLMPFIQFDHPHKKHLPPLPDDQYWQWHPGQFKYVPAYKPTGKPKR